MAGEYVQVRRVVGLKNFKGNVEGKNYDSTTVFLAIDLEDVSEKNADGERHQRGVASEAVKFDDCRIFHTLKDLPCPFEAEITFKKTSNGVKTKEEALTIKPRGTVK